MTARKHLAPAAIFGSGMVLQQGGPVPLWGRAAPGAVVRCCLEGAAHTPPPLTAKVEATADARGSWMLALPALPAGGPCTLTLESEGEALLFTQVYVGEVWLAGGQSNMELPLANSQNGGAALAGCGNARLHFYETPKVTTPAAAKAAKSGWRTVAPDTAANLSAVAYYAAKMLAEALGVHVGILECFWGGTYAHCWMPRARLAAFPAGARRLAWYDARVGDKTDAEFAAECAVYQRLVDGWNEKVTARRAADPQVSWATLNRDYGAYPWPPPAGKTSFQRPGNLYESMLRTICPYGIRGVWYYQGEQDEEWPADYPALLQNLIRCWRAAWGKNTPAQGHHAETGAGENGGLPARGRPSRPLPFLLMQLPMYQSPGHDWPALRAAQAAVAASEPRVWLAVQPDCGESDNIHPTEKQTPGTRLALLALEAVYHRPVQGLPPTVAAARREPAPGTGVMVRFAHTGGQLVLAGEGQGFALAGPDGIFYPAAAVAIGPATLRIACAQVKDPAAVRYAWYNYGPASLYGGTGLAAAPFVQMLPASEDSGKQERIINSKTANDTL